MATVRNNQNTTNNSPVNIIVRLKNPWFWIGITGVLATAIGLSPETVTTWADLGQAFWTAVQNPYTVFSALVAVLGVIIDPTTAGVSDSARAKTYTKPK